MLDCRPIGSPRLAAITVSATINYIVLELFILPFYYLNEFYAFDSINKIYCCNFLELATIIYRDIGN